VILDAGYWMFDTGCWMLDAGYWMFDTGYWMLDAGYWMCGIWGLRFEEVSQLSVSLFFVLCSLFFVL